MSPDQIAAGKRVRLIHDPGRVGVLTGRTRARGDLLRASVVFPDFTEWVPIDQLEPVAGDEDVITLLRSGRVGRASDLRRNLTHVRLSGRLANVIYSMDVTGTDFYPYQFKPVLKLLNSAASGILIADEVGLGKTIEAGLIWTELRSRFDFGRFAVLCPAMLREKWRIELHRRFGVEAEIVDAERCLARLQQVAETEGEVRVAMIGSLQGLRPPRGWQTLDRPDDPRARLAQFLQERQSEDPLLDVLVIDEAHYLRNPETLTNRLGRLLRGVSHYCILLSATPIHLRSADLFYLLNIIDPDTFEWVGAFEELLRANEPLVHARDRLLSGTATADSLRADLQTAASHRFLQHSRQLTALLDTIPQGDHRLDRRSSAVLAYNIDTVNPLGHVVTRTRKRDVTEWSVARRATSLPVRLSEPERIFYEGVTRAVREYTRRAGSHEGFLLCTPQRQMSSCMPAALTAWQEGRSLAEEELYEDLGENSTTDDESRGPLVAEIVQRAREFGDLETLTAHDSKYTALRGHLQDFFSRHPREKLIIFSYFRATLAYLSRRLARDGFPNVQLTGADHDKDAVIREFRDRDGPLILLSSEVGAEGIDLQFCWAMVNYDLPWNPMRVEQRIGRIDRLGQQSPVVAIANLFYADTIDDRIYARLYQRLGVFERTLGSLEPILGKYVHDLAKYLLTNDLTPEQEERRIDQTAQAIENRRIEEERLEEEAAQLVAYGDYILNQVTAARELGRRITGRDIQTYVADFLRTTYPGSECRQVSEHEPEFHITLSGNAKVDFAEFLRNHRLEGTTRLAQAGARAVACRFENSTAPSPRGRSEIINQFHPLVRFVAGSLRERGYAPHPVAAVRLDDRLSPPGVAPGVYVFAVQLWSFQALQDVENLFYSVVPLRNPKCPLPDDDAERIVVAAMANGEDWLTARSAVDFARAAEIVESACLTAADERYRLFLEDLRRRNEDRVDIQLKTLESRIERQRSTLRRVLERHEENGRHALVEATRGRIRALEERARMRRISIEKRRAVRSHQRDIVAGLLLIGGDQ